MIHVDDWDTYFFPMKSWDFAPCQKSPAGGCGPPSDSGQLRYGCGSNKGFRVDTHLYKSTEQLFQ